MIISGNHNEVVVSADRDKKIALAKIKSRLESVEKSNEVLFSRVQNISQRLSTLESQSTNLSSLEAKMTIQRAIFPRNTVLLKQVLQ